MLIAEWQYTTNDTTNTVTLTKYIGSSNNIVVKPSYTIGSKTYDNVVLGVSTSSSGPFVGSSKRTSLTSIKLEDGVKLPTDAKYMFYNCSALTTLNASSWDTSSVTNMLNMFSGCSKLAELDTSGFNTGNVTGMNYMFYGCNSLAALDVSDWDTGSAVNTSYMFYNCTKLAAPDVSHWDTSNVTNMSYMFYYCSAFTELNLSGWNTGKVTNMSYMFQYCSNLITIYARRTFTTTAASSSNYMFRYCNKLVGGNGTAYNSSYTNKTYARIDTPETPGYFTAAPDAASLNSLDVEADSVDENVADGSDAAQVTITVSFVLEDGTVVDQKLVEAILGAAYDVSSVVELLPEGYEIAGEISGELAGEATEDAEVIVPVKAVLADGEDPTPSPEPSPDETENGSGEENGNGNGEGGNTPSPAPTPEVTPEPTPTPEATPEPLPEQTEIDETDVEPEGWTKEEDLTPAA